MKRIFFFILSLSFSFGIRSQNVVLKIHEGLYGQSELQSKVEREVSKLLTEFNAAVRNKRGLNVTGINMTPTAKNEVKQMFDLFPYVCDDPVYVEPCIQTVTGYVIRGIFVTIQPQPDYDDELERELTVCFSSDGQITGAVFSLPLHETTLILGKSQEVKDVARRNEILSFLENYCSFFEKKDINMLEKVFSDRTIEITDKGIRILEENMWKDMLYMQQNNRHYIENLRNSIFKNNKYIRMKFDNIEVVRHPIRSDMYAVSLHQILNSRKSIYHDDGFVTLVWHFSENGSYPKILFRSWLSNDMIKENKDKLFRFDDFFLPPNNVTN